MRYERADLVVLGGGQLGTQIAWRAASRRLSVVLVDAGRPTSSPQPPIPLRRTYAQSWKVRAAIRSLRLWQELQQSLGERLLERFETVELDSGRASYIDSLASCLRNADCPHELLALPELRSRYPRFDGPADARALLQPDGGALRPELAKVGCWGRLQKMGVSLFVDTEIAFVDTDYDQPTAVSGDTAFRGRSMIVAAGARTAALLGQPQHLRPCRTLTARALARPDPLPGFGLPAAGERINGFSPRPGVLRCQSRLAPEQDGEDPRRLLEQILRRWLPETAGTEIELDTSELLEAGDTPVTAPLASRTDVVTACGLDAQDLGLAPWLAETAVDVVTGARAGVGPSPAAPP